jgi:hypothetical protein
VKPNTASESEVLSGAPEIPETDAAMIVAESLSQLEVAGDQKSFDTLFRAMHPDAQAVIPQEAIVGWYANEFPYAGEPPGVAIKVHFAPWTWEVTGKMYPETAHVAVRHYPTDGTVRRELMHLVKDQFGTWGWFFGSDRAFVEEQIERFGP